MNTWYDNSSSSHDGVARKMSYAQSEPASNSCVISTKTGKVNYIWGGIHRELVLLCWC